MKRMMALFLIAALVIGVFPVDTYAAETEFINIIIEHNGMDKQIAVIESGADLLFSGETLAELGGFEYRIEGSNAYFIRGMKVIRVDLKGNRLYPYENHLKVGTVNFIENVQVVDGVYYFPGTEMLPWLNVTCYLDNGELNIKTDEVSIWEVIPDFTPDEVAFDFVKCCKELGINSKYLKARAYVHDEGLSGVFFDMIPVIGENLDYYELFEDILQDQTSSQKSAEELLDSADSASYWMDIAEDFEVSEDIPDEFRMFGEVADFLSNNGVSFSYELAMYIKSFYQHDESVLMALNSMEVNAFLYGLPDTASTALAAIRENYSNYYAGIEQKMMLAIGDTALDGLSDATTGLFSVAIKLLGLAEVTSPDWAEGVNRISSYDVIAEYCLNAYQEMTDHTWMSSVGDLRGLAYMYLYACEQNWRAMADYAAEQGKIDLVNKYEAIADTAEAWQGKFVETCPAQQNDSHEYGTDAGNMKQAYTDSLKEMFTNLAKLPDILNQEAEYVEFLQKHSEYNYYAILDINDDGVLEMLATDWVSDNYTSSHLGVDLYIWLDGKISLVYEDLWSKYSNLSYDSINHWIQGGTGGTGVSGDWFVYLDENLKVREIIIEYYWVLDEAGNDSVETYYNGENITNTQCEAYEQTVQNKQSGNPQDIIFKPIPRYAPGTDANYCCSYPLGTTVSHDLNADGEYEEITATVSYEGIGNLTVGGISKKLDVWLENPTGYYTVINMDGTGKELLIGISAYGPSDDPVTYLYSYDGKQIIDIGYFDDILGENEWGSDSATCNGDGTISAKTRMDVLGTWFGEAQYAYKNHVLKDITDFYSIVWPYADEIGWEAAAKCDFFVYDNVECTGSKVVVSKGTVLYMTGCKRLTNDTYAAAFESDSFDQTMWLPVNIVDWYSYVKTPEGNLVSEEVFDGYGYAG